MLGDREKIYQIYKNLFENAVTHGKPTEIVITYKKVDGYALINIINNGLLISDNIKNSLENGTYNGFGFRIVRKLVAAHGWNIKIFNDKLTNIEIIIPVNFISDSLIENESIYR